MTDQIAPDVAAEEARIYTHAAMRTLEYALDGRIAMALALPAAARLLERARQFHQQTTENPSTPTTTT